uniref:Uncharacterized protein n=1 Tax=Thermus sp. 4C TaxID=446041 RepID=A6MNA5_9DEIN|nr:hypothetical protein [Thermus sp. 4C]
MGPTIGIPKFLSPPTEEDPSPIPSPTLFSPSIYAKEIFRERNRGSLAQTSPLWCITSHQGR